MSASTPTTELDRKEASKELLLADHRYVTEAFLRNEQIGETRVNWFIGIVTGSVGGLIALITKGSLTPLSLRLLVIGGLFWLLAFGLVTLFRIISRNTKTDGYKQDLDKLRQLFSDHFDYENVLTNYHPFGRSPKWKAPKADGKQEIVPKDGATAQACQQTSEVKADEENEKEKEEEEEGEDSPRSFGGLAHMVAAINALLAGALAASIMHRLDGMGERRDLLLPLVIAGVVTAASFLAQWYLVDWREHKERDKLREGRVTHAGGVVFDDTTPGIVKYLVVRPKRGGENKRVLPKGHVEPKENHGETALREVREEAGIMARIIRVLDTVEYEDENKKRVKVKFYLMEKVSESYTTEDRKPEWLIYPTAQHALSHPQSKYFLALAEKFRTNRLAGGVQSSGDPAGEG